jgi:hypothetical protein
VRARDTFDSSATPTVRTFR